MGSDNKKLNRTILALCGICFACGLGYWPWFDKLMQISALPSDEFRSNLLILMAADFGIAIGWERFCRYFFRKLPNPLIPVRVPPLDIVKKTKTKAYGESEEGKRECSVSMENDERCSKTDFAGNGTTETATNATI